MTTSVETYDQCYIAFLDILGFKEIVNSNSHHSLGSLYERIEKYVYHNLSLLGSIDLHGEENKIGCHVISDSIFLWTKNVNSTSFLQLNAMVTRMMVAGFMTGMPLRGGIAKGPLTVKASLLGNTYYGLGLTKAYLLESKQNWSGCIIEHGIVEAVIEESDETLKFIQENHLLEKYDVPLKNGSTENYWTLNWPVLLVRSKDELIEMFEENGKKSLHPDVLKKLENTLEFYSTITERHSEYIDYFIKNSAKSKEDLKIFEYILEQLGYTNPPYNVRPSFRTIPNHEVLAQINQRLQELMLKDINTYNKLKNIAFNSSIHKGEGKWLLELIENIDDTEQGL